MVLMPFRKKKRGLIDKGAAIEHQRLTSLINSMADAVIAVDEEARIALYNGAALNIFDVNNLKAGAYLRHYFQPVDKDNQPVNIDAMIKAATMPTTSRHLRIKYADDSLINIYLSIAPVRLGYGKRGQSGYVLLLRDITREKSLEEERDEFISVVSHELRTPIAIAEGQISNAQLMAKKHHDPQIIQKSLDDAHTQVLFLADMINDLSTLSRAERGALKVEVEPIDVKQLVDELVDNYTPDAAKKNLTIKAEVGADVGELKSSKLYVREILQNFITNAIKYTEKGGLTIKTSPDPKGIKFIVSDTGIGISKGDQERVFDKFFRSEDYRTRQSNGTGLGLYVTIKLTRMIHAEISLDSELNKGSAFTVFVPNLA
jgi:PAS domain S-box-containing protein